jgi:hypothetical protein
MQVAIQEAGGNMVEVNFPMKTTAMRPANRENHAGSR